MKFTEEDYINLWNVFSGGDISTASKSKLERYAVMLSRPHASDQFGKNFPQVCETVRLLILVRISEEANDEAKRMSKAALIIALAALGVSALQVILSFWEWIRKVQ